MRRCFARGYGAESHSGGTDPRDLFRVETGNCHTPAQDRFVDMRRLDNLTIERDRGSLSDMSGCQFSEPRAGLNSKFDKQGILGAA